MLLSNVIQVSFAKIGFRRFVQWYKPNTSSFVPSKPKYFLYTLHFKLKKQPLYMFIKHHEVIHLFICEN